MKVLEAKGEMEYWSYDELIDSMEIDRLAEVSDDDYQGSSRILVRQGERYGVLTFGWGSCSGCDALQGAEDYDNPEQTLGNMIELRDQLWNQITWRDSAAEMSTYLREKDWALDYDEEIGQRFAEKALAVLP